MRCYACHASVVRLGFPDVRGDAGNPDRAVDRHTSRVSDVISRAPGVSRSTHAYAVKPLQTSPAVRQMCQRVDVRFLNALTSGDMSPAPRKRLSAVATPDGAFRVGLEHLEDQYLECRDMRHRWYVSSDYRRVTTEEEGIHARRGHSDYVERRITCDRCSTTKIEAYVIIRERGYTLLRPLGYTYAYADGYLLKGLPPATNASELIRGLRFERAEAEHAAPAKPAKRTRTARSSA